MSSLPYRILQVLVLFLGFAHASHAPDVFWKMWSIDASGNGADGVHIGDINGDGLVDVVSGWEQSGDLMLYLNPGPANVRDAAAWSHVDISGGVPIEGIEDAAFADLDMDGSYDAIISSVEGETQSLGIHWLAGKSPRKPSDWRGFNLASEQRAGYMKARAAQIDGVGGADIVAGTRNIDGDGSAAIFWFKAPVGSHPDNVTEWRRYFVGAVDVKNVTLVLKDMDADTLTDIVFSGRNGVGWFKNPGDQALGDSPASAHWERITIADRGSEFTFCDHVVDGMEDIVVATSAHSGMVAKWLKRLDDSGRHWEEYPISSDTLRSEKSSGKFVIKGVACGYVNGDDQIDVVFTGSGHGHGVFLMSPRTDIATGDTWDLVNLMPYARYIKYDNLRLVDMDADGDLDVVTTEEGAGILTSGQGVLWLENPLAGTGPLPPPG